MTKEEFKLLHLFIAMMWEEASEEGTYFDGKTIAKIQKAIGRFEDWLSKVYGVRYDDPIVTH